MAMNRATLRWFRMGVAAVFAALPLGWAAGVNAGLAPQAVDGGIVIHGTVVTMDHDRSILKNGGVFVRGGQIVATWQGSHVPPDASSAVHVDLGPKTLIFPGLINLHDHPTYDVLNLWPPPSSHRQPLQGRPLGTEPYANRYQWNRMLNLAPPEELRLIDTPQTLLTNNAGLGFGAMVGKYAEVRAMLGGETTTQGDADPDWNLLRDERRNALLAAFAELSDRQRELLFLLMAEPPLSYSEISERLGVSVGSIGPTRGRALERLRRSPAISGLLELAETQKPGA